MNNTPSCPTMDFYYLFHALPLLLPPYCLFRRRIKSVHLPWSFARGRYTDGRRETQIQYSLTCRKSKCRFETLPDTLITLEKLRWSILVTVLLYVNFFLLLLYLVNFVIKV